MQWTKPDFQDIPLNMEVTAYVNTDDLQTPEGASRRPDEPAGAPRETTA
jgi:coenzyme PQQ precursor peptide PqqA